MTDPDKIGIATTRKVINDPSKNGDSLVDKIGIDTYKGYYTPLSNPVFKGKITRNLEGFIPTVHNREYFAAANQGPMELLGNAIGQFASEAVLGTIEGIGYLADIPGWIEAWRDGEKNFDNWLSNWARETKQTINQDILPIYASAASQGFRPFNGRWWAQHAGTVASSLSLLGPTLGVGKGIGTLLGAINKTSKTVNFATQGIAGAISSRHMESLMESNQLYDQAIQQGKSTLEAGEVAAKAYRDNVALLATDIPQYIMLFGAGPGALNKMFSRRAIKGSAVKEGFKHAPLEALEEGYQFVAGKEAELIGSGDIERNTLFGKGIEQRLHGYLTDTEMWTSAWFGAIGGLAIPIAFDRINKAYEKIYGTDEKINTSQMIKDFDNLQMSNESDYLKSKELATNAFRHASAGTMHQLEDMLKGAIQKAQTENNPDAKANAENLLEQALEFEGIYNRVMNNPSPVVKTKFEGIKDNASELKTIEIMNAWESKIASKLLNSEKTKFDEHMSELTEEQLPSDLREIKRLHILSNLYKEDGRLSNSPNAKKRYAEIQKQLDTALQDKKVGNLTTALATPLDIELETSLESQEVAAIVIDQVKKETGKLRTKSGRESVLRDRSNYNKEAEDGLEESLSQGIGEGVILSNDVDSWEIKPMGSKFFLESKKGEIVNNEGEGMSRLDILKWMRDQPTKVAVDNKDYINHQQETFHNQKKEALRKNKVDLETKLAAKEAKYREIAGTLTDNPVEDAPAIEQMEQLSSEIKEIDEQLIVNIAETNKLDEPVDTVEEFKEEPDLQESSGEVGVITEPVEFRPSRPLEVAFNFLRGEHFIGDNLTPHQHVQRYFKFVETNDIYNGKFFIKLVPTAAKPVRGIEIVNTTITTKQGTQGAAQYDRINNRILVNRKLLMSKFKQKAWTKPRDLINKTLHGNKITSRAKALPRDQFKSYQEWEDFVIEHEYQHSILSRKEFLKSNPSATLGDYETEINNRALQALRGEKTEYSMLLSEPEKQDMRKRYGDRYDQVVNDIVYAIIVDENQKPINIEGNPIADDVNTIFSDGIFTTFPSGDVIGRYGDRLKDVPKQAKKKAQDEFNTALNTIRANLNNNKEVYLHAKSKSPGLPVRDERKAVKKTVKNPNKMSVEITTRGGMSFQGRQLNATQGTVIIRDELTGQVNQAYPRRLNYLEIDTIAELFERAKNIFKDSKKGTVKNPFDVIIPEIGRTIKDVIQEYIYYAQPANNTQGYFYEQVTPGTGKFTGKIYLQGRELVDLDAISDNEIREWLADRYHQVRAASLKSGTYFKTVLNPETGALENIKKKNYKSYLTNLEDSILETDVPAYSDSPDVPQRKNSNIFFDYNDYRTNTLPGRETTVIEVEEEVTPVEAPPPKPLSPLAAALKKNKEIQKQREEKPDNDIKNTFGKSFLNEPEEYGKETIETSTPAVTRPIQTFDSSLYFSMPDSEGVFMINHGITSNDGKKYFKIDYNEGLEVGEISFLSGARDQRAINRWESYLKPVANVEHIELYEKATGIEMINPGTVRRVGDSWVVVDKMKVRFTGPGIVEKTKLKPTFRTSGPVKYLKGKVGTVFSRAESTPDYSFWKMYDERDGIASFEFTGNPAEAIAQRAFNENISTIISGNYLNATGVETVNPGKLIKEGDGWRVTEKVEIRLTGPGATESRGKDRTVRTVDNLLYENLEEAEAWFKENFPQIPFRISHDLIRSGAWGRFTQHGEVLLSSTAEVGTIYHESFHVVAGLFLSPAEKISVFNQYRKARDKNLTDDQVEELLAEDFREFMLTDTMPNYAPKSFFQKLLNFIKWALGLNETSIEDMFHNISNGYYAKLKPDFARLKEDKNFSFEKKSAKFTKDVVDGVNYMFWDYVPDGQLVQDILDNNVDNEALKDVYLNIRNRIQKEVNQIARAIKSMSDVQLEETQARVLYDSKQWILDNFFKSKEGISVVDAHRRYLKKFSVKLEEIELTPEHEAISYNADNQHTESATEISAKKTTGNEIKLWLSTITKVRKHPTKNKFYPDLNDLEFKVLENFSTMFSVLANKLAGSTSIEEITGRLEQLKDVMPTAREVIQKFHLNQSGSILSGTLKQRQIKLLQTFGKNRDDYTKFIINKDGTHGYIHSNLYTTQKRIFADWQVNFDNKITEATKKALEEGKTLEFDPALAQAKAMGMIIFNPDLMSPYTQREFAEHITWVAHEVNRGVNPYDKDTSDVGQRIKDLIEIAYDLTTDGIENSHIALGGKPKYNNSLYSYYSYISNRLSAISKQVREEGLSELQGKRLILQALPHLNNVYSANSEILNKIASGEKVDPSIVEGLDMPGRRGKEYAKLDFVDGFLAQLNNVIEGKYHMLRPADNKQERVFDWGTFMRVEELGEPDSVAKPVELLIRYLKDEVLTLRQANISKPGLFSQYKNLGDNLDVDSHDTRLEDKYSPEELKLIRSGIILSRLSLNPEILVLVKDYLVNNVNVNDLINHPKVVAELTNWVNTLIDTNIIPTMNEIGIVDITTKTTTNYLGRKLLKSHKEFPQRTIAKLFLINYMVGNIEQTKLFTGHPALYNNVDDFFKRMSGMVGTKTISAVDEDTNKFLIDKMGVRKSSPGDDSKLPVIGTMRTAVVQDPSIVSDYLPDYKKILKDKAGPYDGLDESDAQALMFLDEYREFKFRQGEWGWRQEATYQWEVQEGWNKNEITIPSSNPYTEIAGKIITRKQVEQQGFFMSPLKPQHFGPLVEQGFFVNSYYKISVIPILPSVAKNHPNLNKVMNKMKSQKIGLLTYATGNKVGTKLNEEKIIQPLYKDGQITDEVFTTQDTDYKYWGIQVNNSPTQKFKASSGTQFLKQIESNLMGYGVPTDYKGKDWFSLSEKDRSSESPIYKKLKELRKLNKLRQNMGVDQLVERLGLKKEEDVYSIDSSKLDDVKRFLANEFIKRDLPTNMIDALRWIDNGIDTLVNREKIENILMSIADNLTISRKKLGKSSVQVSSTLFELKAVRDFSEDGLSSNDLKFYENKDGKITEMEIYLPHYFRELWGQNVNIKNIDSKLLSIIGFRIPTQGLSSIENIRIKDFLPVTAGDIVVVPSELVAKTGSDFDFDKMFLHFPNYEMVNGKPSYISPGTDSIESVENAMMKIHKELLSDPDRFEELISPTDAETFKDLADHINTLRGKDSNPTGFQHMMDPTYVIGKGIEFQQAKQNVGRAALSATSHILFSQVNVYLNLPNNVEILLPHNTVSIEGEEKPSLAGLKDKENKHLISGLLSEMINGYVDAAKDPFMFQINAGPDGANILALLIRLGVPPDHAVSFMNQPIIDEYLEKKRNKSSVYLRQASLIDYKFENQIISKYRPDNIDKGARFNLKYKDKLDGYIKKFDKVDSDVEKMTNAERSAQLEILRQFMDLEEVAEKLRDGVWGTSYDTSAGGKNTAELLYRLRLTERTIEEGMLGNYEKIFEDGQFIQPFYESVKSMKDMFTPYMFHLNNESALKQFERIVDKSMSLFDRERVLDAFKADFMTYLVQTKLDIPNGLIQTYTDDGQFRNRTVPYEIFERSKTTNNPLLKAISVYLQNTMGHTVIDNLSMNSGSKIDKYDSDIYTEAWQELYEQDEIFAKKLGLFMWLQSGTQNSPINFIDLMPNKLYNKIISEALKSINVDNFDNFYHEFFFNNMQSPIWKVVGNRDAIKNDWPAYMIEGDGMPRYYFNNERVSLQKIDSVYNLANNSTRKSYQNRHISTYVVESTDPAVTPQDDNPIEPADEEFNQISVRDALQKIGRKYNMSTSGYMPPTISLPQINTDLKKMGLGYISVNKARSNSYFFAVGNRFYNPFKPSYQLSSSDIPVNERINAIAQTFIDKVGGQVNYVGQLEDDAIARVNTLTRIIDVVETKQGLDTLTEEAVHIMVAMMRGSSSYANMARNIKNFDVYNETLAEYKGLEHYNDQKITEEAIVKLVTRLAVEEALTPQQEALKKSWWNVILDFLRDLFGLDATTEFKKAAKKFIEADTSGLSNTQSSEEFYQIDPNPGKQKDILDKINETNTKEFEIRDGRYFIPSLNKTVRSRPSDRVSDYGRYLYGEAEFTPENKDLYTTKGTIVHAYNQLIMEHLIEGKDFNRSDIETLVYNDLKTKPDFKKFQNRIYYRMAPGQWSNLVEGVTSLYNDIKQRDPGAKIITEQIIYDQKNTVDDIAGTIDLLVVYSDGTIGIYDYKSIKFHWNSATRTYPNPIDKKRQLFDVQLSQYKQMMKNSWELSDEDFRETRIVPINVQYHLIKDKTTQQYYKVEMGRPGLNKEYLQQITVANEMVPEDTELNLFITKLYNERSALRPKAKILKGDAKRNLNKRIENINKTIDDLIVLGEISAALNDIASIVNDIDRDVSNFDAGKLRQYNDLVRLYESFNVAFKKSLDAMEDGKNKDSLQIRIKDYNDHIDNAKSKLQGAMITMAEKYSRSNRSMLDGGKIKEGLGSALDGIARWNNPAIFTIGTLLAEQREAARRRLLLTNKEIDEKDKAYSLWASKQGLTRTNMYDPLINKHGHLITRLTEKFYEDFKKNKSEAKRKYYEEVSIQKEIDWFNKYYEFDEAKWKEYYEKQKTRINESGLYTTTKDKNQALRTVEALNPNMSDTAWFIGRNYYIHPKKDITDSNYIAPEWEHIYAPGNEAAREYLEMYLKFNKEMRDLIGPEVFNSNFIAHIHASTFEKIGTLGVFEEFTPLKDMTRALEIRENDEMFGSRSTIDGKQIFKIPLLYQDPILGNVTPKEKLEIQRKVAQTLPEGSIQYEQEVDHQVKKLQYERGIKDKSRQLSTSLKLMLQSAYDYHYKSEIEDAVLLIRDIVTFDKHKEISTDHVNKPMLDGITQTMRKRLGASNHTVDMVDKFINLLLYNQQLQSKDQTFTRGERTLSYSKVVKLAQNYLSLKALGFNPILGGASFIGASVNKMIVGRKEIYFSNKSWKESIDSFTSADEKVLEAIWWMEPSSRDRHYDRALEKNKSILTRILNPRTFFAFHRGFIGKKGSKKHDIDNPIFGDDNIDNTILIAVMKHWVLQSDGKLYSKGNALNPATEKDAPTVWELFDPKGEGNKIKGLSEPEFVRLRRLVAMAQAEVKGSMTPDQAHLFNTTIYGQMLTKFRNWMPGLVRARMAGFRYNPLLESWEQGHFRTTLEEILPTSKRRARELGLVTAEQEVTALMIGGLFGHFLIPTITKFGSIMAETLSLGFFHKHKIDRKKAEFYRLKFLNEHQDLDPKEFTLEKYMDFRRKQLDGMVTELRYLLGLSVVILGIMTAAGWDEDDENILTYNLYKLAERSRLELSFFFSTESVNEILKSPVPVMRLFTDLNITLKNFAIESSELLGKEENKRDRTPYGYYTLKNIPAVNQVLGITGYFNQVKGQKTTFQQIFGDYDMFILSR